MARRKFSKLREQLEQHEGGRQALDRARSHLDAEIAGYEAGLAEIRRAQGLTQEQLARQLGVSQGEVSRIERRADLFLSTLQSYVEAMGGELELVGVFDAGRVKLTIGDLLSAAGDDQEQDETVAAPRWWDVHADLRFEGDTTSPEADQIRNAILSHQWAVSDAVALRRLSPYLATASFAVEAADDLEARERADEVLKRVFRRTGVVRASLNVELAATVG